MLLTKLNTVELPRIKQFKATKFEKLPNVWLGTDFKKHFLPKVELVTEREVIRVSKLNEYSRDEPIRKELGENHEITLGQLFELLKTADKDKWYIAYVKDVKGEVWAVYAFWYDDGWHLGAGPVADPDSWDAGSRVVSRDSSSLTLEPSEPQALSLFDAEEIRKLKALAKLLK